MPTFRTTFDDNTSRLRRLQMDVRLRRVTIWSGSWRPDGRTMSDFFRILDKEQDRTIHSGALAAIDYIAEVYMPSAKTTQTQPCGDVEQTLREAIGYEPTE